MRLVIDNAPNGMVLVDRSGTIVMVNPRTDYREVIDQWLEEGRACHCYCSKEELDALREQ